MTPRLLLPGVLVPAALVIAGCGAESTSEVRAPSTADGGFPVTVQSCDTDVTFDAAPERAVTNDLNTFEYLVALELTEELHGTFSLSGFGPVGADGDRAPVPERYQDAYDRTDYLSPDIVALEPLVAAEPDFLFAGWNYGLRMGTTLTPENLESYGIATYVLRESCAHVLPDKLDVDIEDTYTDLTNLGAIFGVPERAEALVAQMRADVEQVQEQVGDAEPVSVFLYDGGTDAPFTAPGLAMPDALIELAGGRNVFTDLDETWTSVSWEQVVAAQPECIVVNDYGSPTYEQKVRFLQRDPRTRDLPAVQDDCFVQLDYGQLTPSPENARAVQTIARVLHPDLVTESVTD